MTYLLSRKDKGQIILPEKWYNQFKTKNFTARSQGRKLILEPVESSSQKWDKEVQNVFLAGYADDDSVYDKL